MYYSNGQLNLFASDLQSFLACKRITYLDHEVAKGNLNKPDYNSPSAAILQELGNEHEESYIRHLESQGHRIIRLEKRDDSKKAHDEAVEAMKAGYDIIAQPRMNLGNWGGYADILVKREGKSEIGEHYYEVQDTKLSQTTKAATILQLSLYTEMVNAIQGPHAKVIGVIKPGDPFEKEEFKVADFEAYYRFIKKQFEEVMTEGVVETYPLPVEKCAICPWWKSCRGKWLADDHLSLVAGLQRSHTKILNEYGIETVEKYANEPNSIPEKPRIGSLETYDKLHGQAKVQVEGRSTKDYFELRPEWFNKNEEESEPRGLNQLPPPNSGDIYFDFEGEHFYQDGGLEYLFGYAVLNSDTNEYDYHRIWALDREQEKAAFVQFMKFLQKQEELYPDFHIYHFAPYEPAALARLASRHALFEVDVDDLLRKKKFVDLHRVIKESMQAAVEKYSLKDLEGFAGFVRAMDLQLASESRRTLGAALNLDQIDCVTDDDKLNIEEYNKEDCLATLFLHQWLEKLFADNKASLGLSRPDPNQKEVDEKIRERERIANELFEALKDRLPSDKESDEYKAMWLLLNSISYFRREERMAYFEFFRIKKLSDDELMDEKNALAYLKFHSTVQDEKGKSSLRYSFDPQELSGDFNKLGTQVVETHGKFSGRITLIDLQNGTIDIASSHENYERTFSVQLYNIISQKKLEDSLHAYVKHIIENGFISDIRYDAMNDLLLRRSPRLKDGSTLADHPRGSKVLNEYAVELVTSLDNSILPIQGPPGTGKTHLGGQMILELIKSGRKVGVTAIGHKTIQNLISKVNEHAQSQNINIETTHLNKRGENTEEYPIVKSEGPALKAISAGKLVGGTAFFWADPKVEQLLDYLFIDEAGQMSLTQILAAAKAAKNLVFLGDPQQLEQPQQGAHPENSDISGLEHLLGGEDTIAVDKGIFIDTTWRLPKPISQFTSLLYYDGKLLSHPDTSNQKLTGSEMFKKSGLYYVPVSHEGNQNKSEEEIEVVAEIVEQLLKAECKWTDREGKTHSLSNEDFRVIAPYNVQVNALKERLPEIQVGTVDKFQGQEAPVVIYSMTSSSSEDAPRGMGFLYDTHRMNVATSRAQCISILVANKKLFEPECHSIDQMQMANGMCRYKEMATTVQII